MKQVSVVSVRSLFCNIRVARNLKDYLKVFEVQLQNFFLVHFSYYMHSSVKWPDRIHLLRLNQLIRFASGTIFLCFRIGGKIKVSK